MTQKFRVVFEGTLKEGCIAEDIKQQLANDYQKNAQDFDSWFSGQLVVLRKETTQQEAEEISRYFDRQGMVVVIEPLESDHEEKMIDARNQSDNSVAPAGDLPSDVLIQDALTQLKTALEQAQGEFNIIRPARFFPRVIAFMIDNFILCMIVNMVLRSIVMPLGMIDLSVFDQALMTIAQTQGNAEAETAFLTLLANNDFLKALETMVYAYFIGFGIYFGVLEYKWQMTLGKRLLGLRVFSLVSPRVTLGQSFKRTLSYIAGSILCSQIALYIFNQPDIGFFMFLLTLLIGLVDKKQLNQTLYDIISKTVVGYR